MSEGNLTKDWSEYTDEELREINRAVLKQEHRATVIPCRRKYGSTPVYEIAGLIHAIEMVPPSPPECKIVEIGSLYGKTTIALASLRIHEVISIDPHDGPWEIDGEIKRDRRAETGNTLDEFTKNLVYWGVDNNVRIIQKYSDDAAKDWNPEDRICIIFIDGCHDYEQVLKDFWNFEPHMIGGCLVAFHDYNPNTFPGVIKAVDEIEAAGRITHVFQLGSLKVFTLK